MDWPKNSTTHEGNTQGANNLAESKAILLTQCVTIQIFLNKAVKYQYLQLIGIAFRIHEL